MFIGSFLHPPNADAVRWFVTDVLPLIRRELPDVEFTILGNALSPEITSLASASVHPVGYVADADSHFARARVFVCPLRYGAGMKGKIGHSMSVGLPVVTTTAGAEGMMLTDGETALIADGPEAFAAAVVKVYLDERLWTDISDRAKTHIATHFSDDVVRESLHRIFPRNRAISEDATELDVRRA